LNGGIYGFGSVFVVVFILATDLLRLSSLLFTFWNVVGIGVIVILVCFRTLELRASLTGFRA
jgi:hypothetical protein